MHYKVTFTHTIECGENTCATDPGKFCKYMHLLLTGDKARCLLFGDLLETSEPGGRGWMLRCNQCMTLAQESHE